MKLQHAMEYLVTYGIAILIIAVAIGGLYSYGVFRGSQAVSSVCVAGSGFTCANPTIAKNDIVSVSLGAVASPITITAVGCSKNQTAPQNTVSTNIALNPGTAKQVNFTCPGPNNAISSFSGSLWIVGNSGYQTNVIEQVATVNVHGTPTSSTIIPTTTMNTTTTSASTTTSTTIFTTTIFPPGAQDELNNATADNFSINSMVISATSVSQCSKFQINYCNNNQFYQYICINSAYTTEMQNQWNTIYANDTNDCSDFSVGGYLTCNILTNNYCLLNSSS